MRPRRGPGFFCICVAVRSQRGRMFSGGGIFFRHWVRMTMNHLFDVRRRLSFSLYLVTSPCRGCVRDACGTCYIFCIYLYLDVWLFGSQAMTSFLASPVTCCSYSLQTQGFSENPWVRCCRALSARADRRNAEAFQALVRGWQCTPLLDMYGVGLLDLINGICS